MSNTNHPDSMPLLALRGMVLFPNMVIHFDLGREQSIRAARHALKNNVPIFIVTQRDIRVENPTIGQLYRTGTIANIRQILEVSDRMVRIVVEGKSRALLRAMTDGPDFSFCQVDRIPEQECLIGTPRTEALFRKVLDAYTAYISVTQAISQDVVLGIHAARDLSRLCDYTAQSLPLRWEDKQRVLDATDPTRRVNALIRILAFETEVQKLGQQINSQVKARIDEHQREMLLREQLKEIQDELGEGMEEEEEADSYVARIKALKMDPKDQEYLIKEANRLSRIPMTSPESNMMRSWLDAILELPWSKTTKDRTDVAAAEKILNRDHYGMEKVKERILELLAVRKLTPNIKGQVICLAGPPGVGKTSVGISIAKAMNRKYARISLGGVRDEADIRGHRKTYLGAMPGRIMTALRQAGSSNAMILLDEVDKMSSDFRGDPVAALLEVLDTAQNSAFRDHYLEVAYDISDVLFVITANDIHRIPAPLLDRVEIIEMSSYTDEEKLQIAKQHLFPRELKKHGLTKRELTITDDAVRSIISLYTRESGVRELERQLGALCRKTAKRIATEEQHGKQTVTPETLEADLGTPRYKPDAMSEGDEIGLVNGLAWTSVGGTMLPVEVNVMAGTGKLEITGNLGNVMKESAKAAITCVRSRAEQLGIDPDFYQNRDIHIHCPEGAIPKDGPSAGVTMATAITSALTNRPVRRDIAMTGEITLRGRVLAIGGLREKTMAALRAGVHTVFIPKDNEPDLAEIDPLVRNALEFVPVSDVDEILSRTMTREAPETIHTTNTTPAQEAPAAEA